MKHWVKMFQVKQYLEQNPSKHLFPFVDYLPEYKENFATIDDALLSMNGDWWYVGLRQVEASREQQIAFDVESFIYRILGLFAINEYKYKTLADSTHLDYNPIENYNMVEEGEDTTKGSVNKVFGIGEQTLTDNTTLGSQKVTTDMVRADKKNTAVDNVSPMNTANYVNKSQRIEDYNGYTDTDTVTSNSRTDVNTRNIGARNDSDDTETDMTTTHKLTRSGNVGVTTSQQMVLSERQVADFSIYLVIWEDVVNNLLVLLDEPTSIFGDVCEFFAPLDWGLW